MHQKITAHCIHRIAAQVQDILMAHAGVLVGSQFSAAIANLYFSNVNDFELTIGPDVFNQCL